MRKEILIAVTLGIFVGIAVAFGVWRANTAFNGTSKQPNEIQDEPSLEEDPQTLNVTVAQPEKNDVVTASPVTLSGIATQGSWIVVSSENEDFIFPSDEEGAFEQEVEPLGGVNQEIIAVFDENGEKTQTTVTYVFSTEFADQVLEEQEEVPEATDEADAVRQRVQERLEQKRQNPKAFIGSITDKTEDTLQIRDLSGEIKLISANEELADFVQTNGASTEVSYADVAIGDFLVAMGFSDGNGVLDARRVLLTAPTQEPSREIVFGEVLSTERRAATLRTPDGEEITIDFPARWKGPEVEELEEGTKVIAVLVDDDDGEQLIRTIEIISDAASLEAENNG